MSKEKLLNSNIILSILILLMGVIIMIFKSFGLIDLKLYMSVLFFILAFISTIAYFVNKKEGDYEILIQALVSVITATYIIVLGNESVSCTLGMGLVIFNVLEIINRIVVIIKLKNKDNLSWIIKFITTFAIFVLAVLTSINLFKDITVPTMMIAYYFITFGFILSLENFIITFASDKKIRELLSKLLEDEEKKKLEDIKEKRIKKIKNVKKSTQK